MVHPVDDTSTQSWRHVWSAAKRTAPNYSTQSLLFVIDATSWQMWCRIAADGR